MWVLPVSAMVAALIVARLTRYLNSVTEYHFFGFGMQGARAAVSMIAASTLTFVVFFFSVLLLTVQVASASLSPRIIARPFQSHALKASLALFVFTFIYGVAVLGRLEDQVLELPVFITVVLSVASVGTFLFVVEFVSKELRPVTVVAGVASDGLHIIRTVYPLPWTGATRPPEAALSKESVCQSFRHEGNAGVVIAFHLEKLLAMAVKHDCVIELVPQVGDYVPSGGHLFQIRGGRSLIRAKELRNAIMLGRERTMEQDPAFAFRIIVDIAEKALSAAINDPTTAVLAIDQIQCLLQEVGERDLSTGVVKDEHGRVRLIYRTPNWQDFVLLAVSEVRQCGANSVQITRRLHGMLESLITVLPPARAPALQQQLDLLRAAVERSFLDPPDRFQAEIADSQGLGGTLHLDGDAEWTNPDPFETG
ncbi:MAG TPA: DUF2254 domain-containing protein [Bryobacteraceae bacterium]|nr:DUF2254 domain-containing protein [Bryobacteraceae bacterium]